MNPFSLAPTEITKTPRVSAVLPVFNAARYLRATLGSILAQTFEGFELIAIDDASTDGSLEILESIRDPRIKIHRNRENLRLIRTLNRGVELAQGDYIARCDADDIYDPERFAAQVQFLDDHPDIAVVGSDAWLIDAENRIVDTTYNFPITPIETSLRLGTASPLFHSSVMARRQAILDAGSYSVDHTHVEDYGLWLRVCRCSKVANLRRKLTYYRVHAQSVSRKYAKQQADSAERLRRLYGVDSIQFRHSLQMFPSIPHRMINREAVWTSKSNLPRLFSAFLAHPLWTVANVGLLALEVARAKLAVTHSRLFPPDILRTRFRP
ncbi:MAG: glycosyltransferase [Verrucomicrobiota bacterium]